VSAALPDDVSVDALLRGRVQLVQPRRGFRASLDPVLLAGFVGAVRGRFLDIGCGTGALSFVLLARHPEVTGVGVEIQPRLAACVAAGARLNRWDDRFVSVNADVVSWAASAPRASFDLVVTNPPFRKGSPPSPDPERARAHHEGSLSLAAWVGVAADLVRPSGRVAAIFEAARQDELARALLDRGLRITRSRQVVPRTGQVARRVLIEAVAAAASATVDEEPPLEVHGPTGFSPEVAAWLEPTF